MKSLYTYLIIGLLLVGCAKSTKRTPLDMLQDIDQIQLEEKAKESKLSLRMASLKKNAFTVGAQAGLAYRTKIINKTLEENKSYLDTIFNFEPLMIDANIIPPVLIESRNTLQMYQDRKTIRVADQTYTILRQAFFSTTIPNWTYYLLMSYPEPDLKNNSLLPQNSDERKLWKDHVKKGWHVGIKQADEILQTNLNRLKRDYQGMVRYRLLLAQNMVSAPEIARRDLGVTGGGDTISINDKLYNIQALPSLKADSTQWKTIITQ